MNHIGSHISLEKFKNWFSHLKSEIISFWIGTLFFSFPFSLQRNHWFNYLEDPNRRSLFVVENYPLDAMICKKKLSNRKWNYRLLFYFQKWRGFLSSHIYTFGEERLRRPGPNRFSSGADFPNNGYFGHIPQNGPGKAVCDRTKFSGCNAENKSF